MSEINIITIVCTIIVVIGALLVAYYKKPKPKLHIIDSSQGYFPNTIDGRHFLLFEISAKNVGDTAAHIYKIKSSGWEDNQVNVTILPAQQETFTCLGPRGNYKKLKKISIYLHGRFFPVKHHIDRYKYLLYDNM